MSALQQKEPRRIPDTGPPSSFATFLSSALPPIFWKVITAVSFLCVVAAPWISVSLVAFAALIVASSVLLMNAGTGLRQALFWFMLLAFVFSPYWALANSNGPFPPWLVAAALTIFAGVWSWYQQPQETPSRVALPTVAEVAGWIVLAILWLALQIKAIAHEIPWRGDEYFHIDVTQDFMATTIAVVKPIFAFDSASILALGLVAFAVALRVAYSVIEKKGRLQIQNRWVAMVIRLICRYAWVGALVLIWVGYGLDSFEGFRPKILRRYPYVRGWFAALPAWKSVSELTVESPWWLRIGGCASVGTAGILVFSWVYRSGRGWILAFLLGAGFLTLPIVVRHGSPYYMEPYLLLALLVVVVNPSFLGATENRDVRTAPQNVALCAVPLLKETGLAVIGAVALARGLVLLLNAKRKKMRLLRMAANEAVYLGMLASGLFLFLYYQSGMSPREFKLVWANLSDSAYQSMFLKTLWTQMGVLPVFGVLGVVALILKHDWVRVTFLTGLLAAFYAVFGLDELRTLGLSRQNLHFLAPLCGLAFTFILSAGRFHAFLGWTLAVTLIAANMWLFPMHWKSGLTHPQWGTPRAIWFDIHFPVQETVDWLRENQRGRRTMVYAHDYGYAGLEWAIEKEGFTNIEKRITLDQLCPAMARIGMVKPEDIGKLYGYMYHTVYTRPQEGLGAALAVARAFGHEIVVYLCVTGTDPPALPATGMQGYQLSTVLKNHYHGVAIFEKAP